jgi:carbon-monoxide dehydrogenase medium subunit
MVGSLAYAHPAAEWPAIALTLDGELDLASRTGVRVISATEFFRGPGATACAADEIVTELRLRAPGPSAGVGFAEYRRTQASFAVVAAIVVLELDGRRITSARIGLAGAADRPMRAGSAERTLVGRDADAQSFDAAAAAAADESAPLAEPHCSVEYRRHVIAVLVGRALRDAGADGGLQCT